MAAVARLIGQVPQGVIGISSGGIAVVVVGRNQPVQGVVGVQGLVLRLCGVVEGGKGGVRPSLPE